MPSKEYYDHLGNRYNSIEEMCKAYNIDTDIFKQRYRKRHWDLKRALTAPVRNKPSLGVKDHLGNEFNTYKEMCKFYGIKEQTFRVRLKKGYSVEDALGAVASHKIKDHKGNEFNNINEMCKYWKTCAATFRKRITSGMSMEQALEYDKKLFVDHNGIEYKSLKDMCKHYNIGVRNFENRKILGWDLEKILTTPVKRHNSNLIIFGNKYNLSTHDGSSILYHRLVKLGWDKEVAICTEDKHDNSKKLSFIGLDNKAYYKMPWSDDYVTARQIVEHYRPDLVSLYDKYNPTGEYNPYRG